MVRVRTAVRHRWWYPSWVAPATGFGQFVEHPACGCNDGPVRSRAPAEGDRANGLLERSSQLERLRAVLAEVEETGRGRLVLIGGEAGVGKTALLQRFIGEHDGVHRTLWGACDALFTPPPLAPLLDVAHVTGGRLNEVIRSEATPRGGIHVDGRVGEQPSDSPRARRPPLGGRGHARRRTSTRSADRHGRLAGPRQLPRRRARPGPSATTRAWRAGDGPRCRPSLARAAHTCGGGRPRRAARRRSR